MTPPAGDGRGAGPAPGPALARLRVGVAGWSVPAASVHRFPPAGSHLERYAARLPCVEINSSFYRPHRRSTYARWAASVPKDFRFAVKLPKLITHERRLVDCGEPLARFADETGGLGARRGPVLVQLPPSFAFEAARVEDFFAAFAASVGGPVACEPRHPSWFAAGPEALLRRCAVARVAADPPPVPAAAQPGGWPGLASVRLHGSPIVYRSAYGGAGVARHAAAALDLARAGAEVWIVYDNTAAGAATDDALALLEITAMAASG